MTHDTHRQRSDFLIGCCSLYQILVQFLEPGIEQERTLTFYFITFSYKDWWRAINLENQAVGYVPSNYISPFDDLTSHEYIFHQNCRKMIYETQQI